MNYTEQDLYGDLSTEKVNWDVFFIMDEEIGPVVNVRARPYKTDRNTGRMVLAGGRTLVEAFSYAQMGLIQSNYVPLDWSQRQLGTGIAITANSAQGTKTRKMTAQDLQDRLNGGYATDTMSEAPQKPQKPAQ